MTVAEAFAGRDDTRAAEPQRPPAWLIPAMIWSVVLTSLAVFGFLAFGHRYDFMMFYQDGLAWNRGEPLYKYPNLNPPSLTIAVFAPLARLPFDRAAVLWLALDGLMTAAAMRWIVRELRLTVVQAVTAVVLLFAFHATYFSILNGQITWLLLIPITRAWLAFRHRRVVRAGLWLGPVIAVKPTFALAALLLPWQAWVAAGTLAAALTGLAVTITGVEAWYAWQLTGRTVDWISQHMNASLWGLAARWQLGVTLHVKMTDLRLPVVAATLAVGALLAATALRVRDADRRFMLALLWCVLLSPLGWIHYLPLAAGPAAASWPRDRRATAAFLLLCVPLGFLSVHFPWTPLFARTIGSIYPTAILLAWIAWARAPRRLDPRAQAAA